MATKLVTAIIFVAGLAACSNFSDHPIGEIPPIQGDKHTSRLGITVYVPAGSDGAKYCSEVDATFEEWVAYWAKKESLQRADLLSKAMSLPAVLYSERSVANRAGFCKYGSHVGIALQSIYYDPFFGMFLSGVRVLIHEWTHILKGSFHPV